MSNKNSTPPPGDSNMSSASGSFSKQGVTSRELTKPANKPSKRKLSLLVDFPAEIRNHIRQYLDPTSSTALGLTCRYYYQCHWRWYGRVPLHSMVQMTGEGGGPWQISLAGLLRHWMGKPGVGLKFSTYNMLYVSKERWEELEELM